MLQVVGASEFFDCDEKEKGEGRRERQTKRWRESEREADMGRHTCRQTGRQIDRQTNRQTDIQRRIYKNAWMSVLLIAQMLVSIPCNIVIALKFHLVDFLLFILRCYIRFYMIYDEDVCR